MICAAVSGSQVVILQSTPCQPTDLVLVTYSEYASATASPFTLTVAEGSLIAAAILGVWALGWTFKKLQTAINGGSPE